jgi:hypothetical protein
MATAAAFVRRCVSIEEGSGIDDGGDDKDNPQRTINQFQ